MCPAVHPVTGATYTSYKKAIKDPVIAEMWKTAFGKEFGGMAQGGNKTNTKGTNAMFVMSHDDINRLAGTKYTYANIVLDHRPQKDDPNRIRITAGGNLIQYDNELSVRTADISTAKLH
jgi:protein-disulfide isomerase-like protein with CxxC motif